MVFAGLPLGTLLAIGAGFAALTVVLYILKLRRRPVPVPFTRLWQEVLAQKQSSSLFSQLKRWLSLLLQLLIVAALVLALGDPKPAGHRTEGRTFVVLLDSSASMSATDEKPTRFAAAKDKLNSLIEGLASVDRMLIVSMGATPRPLTTLTDDSAVLKKALENLSPSDTGADLDEALRFAEDALRGQARPEIVVLSDGALGPMMGPLVSADSASNEGAPQKTPGTQKTAPPPNAPPPGAPGPNAAGSNAPQEAAVRSGASPETLASLEREHIKLSYVKVGKTAKNVAITQFAVRRYPLDKSRYEAMLELTNTNPEPVNIELSLLGDGAVVDVTRLALGPSERLRRFYPDLGGASRDLEARIRFAGGGEDDLPVDNRAFATLPERRRARVLVVSAGNAYLEAAVLLDEYLNVTEIQPSAYPPEGTFDVTIFDNVAPPRVARTGAALYLGPPAEGPDAANVPVKSGPALEMFGFDEWDEKSPLLRFMAMPDIQVLTGHELVPEKGDKVLGSSVEENGRKHPILVSGTRPEGAFVALGFDPRRSDMVLRIGFPLFVLNVIDAFSAESTEALSSFRTGEVWRVPLGTRRVTSDADAGIVEVKGPAGQRVEAPLEDQSAVLFGERAGFYDVGGVEPPLRFAASLSDAAESRIEPHEELAPGVTAGKGPELGVTTRRSVWVLLLLGVLLVSLVEWITYHRRWTV
jgi:hypothetical protein